MSHATRVAEPRRRCGTGPERLLESEPDGGSHHCATRGTTALKIVYPNDASTASLVALAATADSDILFIGDARVKIEPSARMFERMTQVMRDTLAGWVYS